MKRLILTAVAMLLCVAAIAKSSVVKHTMHSAILGVREGGHDAICWRTSLHDVLTFVSIGFAR